MSVGSSIDKEEDLAATKQSIVNNPFASQSLRTRKSNSVTATDAKDNPLKSLRKGLLMSNVASPIMSSLINNSSTEASFTAYDGTKVV
jgi:hypothetical protein